MTWISALDERLFRLLNGTWTNPFLDVVMPWITDFDHWRLPIILLLLVVLARGRAETRVAILFAILAVVAADQLCSSGVKPLFDRPRPFRALDDVRKLVGAHSSSFPSSHAANTFAAATFLLLRFRRLWPILVVPVVVAWSRVYVGVHYPLDVLGGAVLGAAVGTAFWAIERTARRRWRRGHPPADAAPDPPPDAAREIGPDPERPEA